MDVFADMGGGFTSAAGGECLVRRHVEDVARGAGGGQPVGVELRRLNVACGLDDRRRSARVIQRGPVEIEPRPSKRARIPCAKICLLYTSRCV